jgi:antitoxin component YwqK of YwqJK toxin-antitoxin module
MGLFLPKTCCFIFLFRTMKRFLLSYCFLLPLLLAAQPKNELNPNGLNRYYYPNGQVSSEGSMRDGKPDGYWKTYYDNGKLKSEGNRKDFQLDSLWKFYTEEGKLSLEFDYKNGKKNGYKKTYNKEGHVDVEELYADDVKQGYTNYYYKEGTLWKKIPFEKGREEGMAYEFSSDSTLITLIEYKGGFIRSQEKINRRDATGSKQGVWKDFYSEGHIKSEGHYLDDMKHGYFKEYDKGGNLQNTYKYEFGKLVKNAPELAKLEVQIDYHPNGRRKFVGNFKNGVPEGVSREYDTIGNIVNSQIYQDGILVSQGIYDEAGYEQGHWKEYHPNGALKAEGDYKNGRKVGPWVFYHPNGAIEQKGVYSAKGEPQGEWKWFYEDGKLLREETYIDGLVNGTMVEYADDSTSHVITKGELIDGLKEGPWFFEMADYREEGTYKGDKREGMWKHIYTTNGKTRFEGNFTDGQPDGKHVFYFENGHVWMEGKFIFGRREGDWKYYDEETSTLILTITYKDDVEVKFDGQRIKVDSSSKDTSPKPAAPPQNQ